MGQKANPIALRLQLNKNWSSLWFEEKNFADYFLEDVLIREETMKKIGRSGAIDKIEIKRDAREITIIINTAKPGLIIGRSGKGIEDLNKYLIEKLLLLRTKRSLSKSSNKLTTTLPKNLTQKIKIEIIEIKKPETHANLIAQNIASQLEKRIAYRRAVKQAISKVRQNREVKGIKVVVSGRLGGVEIARRERFFDGSIPLGTFKANVDYAQQNAYTTYGVIGIKVWIYIISEKP